MDLSRPHTIFGETVESDVLATLARTTRPLTGRAIARVSGRSQKRVLEVLHRLAGNGLVHEEEAGPAILFTLNRDHLAFPAIMLITGLRSVLIDRIRQAVDSWEIEPVHVSIFGSAARGDGDAASDVDMFVVRSRTVAEDEPGWRSQLEEIARNIHSWSGNHAGISEVGERELPRLRRERPPVVANLQKDAIQIHGPTPAELLKRSS